MVYPSERRAQVVDALQEMPSSLPLSPVTAPDSTPQGGVELTCHGQQRIQIVSKVQDIPSSLPRSDST